MPRGVDVFFSYSTVDHAAVERVARALHERGIRVFLNRWYLAAGQPWPQALEQTLVACGAVAVFVGADGLGPGSRASGTWRSTGRGGRRTFR